MKLFPVKDLEWQSYSLQKPATHKTFYQTASISKSVATTARMTLYD